MADVLGGLLLPLYHDSSLRYWHANGNQGNYEACRQSKIQYVKSLMHYMPYQASLNPQTVSLTKTGGIVREKICFQSGPFTIPGILLRPDKEGVFPGIIAMHDHGGNYWFGAEKIAPQETECDYVNQFKKQYYAGKNWAEDLARRGYVVLAIDALYFGERRLDLNKIPKSMLLDRELSLFKMDQNTAEFYDLYNSMCGRLEEVVVRSIQTAGATWPGILLLDDGSAVDYLYTRSEVDKTKIGCCGLSVGGFRSGCLAALDERISCSVVTGWTTTLDSMLEEKFRYHTFMVNIPGLGSEYDFPDLVALCAPRPLFVQQCKKDALFTMDGMQDACAKIRHEYDQAQATEKFKYRFYDNPHQFNEKMQSDAFDWLDIWLK